MLLICSIAAATLFWLFAAAQGVRLQRMLSRFGSGSDAPSPPPGEPWPKVSIIVPARDEERAVEAAVRSLLKQDYPALEVVAVDDRSTDKTGDILRRLAAEDARLTVVSIESLPGGWLGKNHANAQGAARAGGDWLLFTDADVTLGGDTLRRAVAFGLRYRLGHVVALPRFLTEGVLESAFVSCFCFFFTLKIRLWQLLEPGTRAFIGSGTFNLVRRSDYQRSGGHERLRLEVADDMKLGLILRRGGVRQGVFDPEGGVAVRWQDGSVASMRGLVKNAFSGMEWRWDVALGSAAGISAISILPAILLVFLPPELRLWQAVPVALSMLLHGLTARRVTGGSGIEGFLHPVMSLLFIGVILWSALSATLKDGISWRGTRYRLSELKAGCVRDADYPLGPVVGWDARPS